jgi:type IV pilus assembly protein PilA
MKRVQQGFTLIELMIVVAIIGILAAVALPAYQDYTIRAQVSEGMSLIGGAKTSVADYYADKGEFPDSDDAAAFDGAVGKYVSSVSIGTDGVITATFGGSSVNANISGETLEYTPAADTTTNNVTWSCVFSGEQKYVPQACRGS